MTDKQIAKQQHEKAYVEEPFLKQIEGLNWTAYRQEPSGQLRSGSRQVLLDVEVRKKVKELNPWLTDDQLDEVVRGVSGEFHPTSLIDSNEQVLQLLLEGATVQGNEQTGDKSGQKVHLVNFEKPERNSFIAISQFRLHVPGKERPRFPDIVLFLNGIPIVVVECKSPKIADPIGDAIDQICMYANIGEYEGEGLGNPRLFYYNAFTIVTCQDDAKFGTVSTTREEYFYRWMSPYPYDLNDIESITQSSPTCQERLVQGMLNKANLLSLIRTFSIFKFDEKKRKMKIVGRYQQFKAVKKVIHRLLTETDPKRRGGIIWHTQGSGKSLTMVFLVREMYHYKKLQKFKVVFVTDRTDLERQLGGTVKGIGYTVKEAKSITDLRDKLSNDSSDLVMAMIQKFQPTDIERLGAALDDAETLRERREIIESIFPELNASPNILVMIDEAHRSQYKVLGASLEKALPNATRLAFTGTPIEKTENTFGDYIDMYTMRHSIEDGVTLEIIYEGRTTRTDVPTEKREAMDQVFWDVFRDYSPEECQEILLCGSRQAYLESKNVITAKARDMVRHYINHVFRNGFKAQVVCYSREAAVRYKDALDEAFVETIAELEQDGDSKIDLETLKRLKIGVVISGQHKDKDHIAKYTNSNDHDKLTDDFKLPFGSEGKGEPAGYTGFLVVNNMLLTGFDAPVEQVLYIDRVVRDHTLLQAIARVNRVNGEVKTCGFVVDYVGIGHHIKEALEAYQDKEVQEIQQHFRDYTTDLDRLRQSHRDLVALIKGYGIDDWNDLNAFFDLFFDENTRFEVIIAFKNFSNALDRVYPRKEALEFLPDFKRLVLINHEAMKHTRDQRFKRAVVTRKLRDIADEYLEAEGVDTKVEPISILDDQFHADVKKKERKARAQEMIHAIRAYIDEHMDGDPDLMMSYSEMLEHILEEFQANWEMIFQKLEELRKKIRDAYKNEPTYGLDRQRHMPFFRLMNRLVFGSQDLNEQQISLMVNNTKLLVEMIEEEVRLNDFWTNVPAQNKLKGRIQEMILSAQLRRDDDGNELLEVKDLAQKRGEIISECMQLAYSNRKRLRWN